MHHLWWPGVVAQGPTRPFRGFITSTELHFEGIPLNNHSVCQATSYADLGYDWPSLFGEKQRSGPKKNSKPIKTTTMKTMKDFASQQLSKRQMNQVRGGDYLCVGDKNAESFVFKGGMEHANLHQMWASVNGVGGMATCHKLL